ncbi:hypothetical protein [Sporosarcina sp. ANT_H38]|nr:hypothetical protein [Sporosarcina sp. ANT_H38]
MGITFGKDTATQLSGKYDVVAVPELGKKTAYEGTEVGTVVHY